MTFGVALEVLRKQSNCWDKITECPVNCEKCECYVDASDLVEAVRAVLDNFPTQMSGTSDNRSEKPNDCDMTLDEAIQHAEDVAKAKNDEAEEARLQEQDKYADECIKCATEHRQLAEWLGELAVLREKVNCSELPNSSDDCVSRRAVIDRINWWFGILKQNPDILIDAIKTMPSVQAEQKWILCSERLPENFKPVIVTWKNNDPASYYQYIVGKHFIGVAHYKNDTWYWYSSVTEDFLAEYGKYESEEFDEAIEVIAWMPLPEPYRGDNE